MRAGARLNVRLFFFQAEDGIRDHCVTGVQTCALPISSGHGADDLEHPHALTSQILKLHAASGGSTEARDIREAPRLELRVRLRELGRLCRSEERRVGKESSARWAWQQYVQRLKIRVLV